MAGRMRTRRAPDRRLSSIVRPPGLVRRSRGMLSGADHRSSKSRGGSLLAMLLSTGAVHACEELMTLTFVSLDRQGRHIPGSGIDLATVRELRLVPTIETVAVRGYLDAVRSLPRFGPERILVAKLRAEVGDIVAQVRESRRRTLLGRPMQVRAVRDVVCFLADDPSLGPPREVDPVVSWNKFLGLAAVWAVLEFWGVRRCPRCGAPALHPFGNEGPAPPGYFTTGCALTIIPTDETCARCGAEWPIGDPNRFRLSVADDDEDLLFTPSSGIAQVAIETGFDMTLNAELIFTAYSAMLHFGGAGYGSGWALVTRDGGEEDDQLGRPYFTWKLLHYDGELMAGGEEYVHLDGKGHPLEVLAALIDDISKRCSYGSDEDDDALLPPVTHLASGVQAPWWVYHEAQPGLAALREDLGAVIAHLDG
jgi:hypothetical protein